MPEISRFFGIIIRMYAEPDAPHHQPHFHAYYQQHTAVFNINTIELISGSVPRKQRRFIEAWAELHKKDLLKNWKLLQSGELPNKVEPLQ